jgi:hypothetical protein
MRTPSRLLPGAFAVLLLLTVAHPASAQFIAPMRYNEGPGVKISDSFVFHPGISIAGHFDSNPLQKASDVTAAGFLRILAHLDLATLSPQRRTNGDGSVSASRTAEFRLKTAVSFREYLSGNDSVKQMRALELDAGIMLALFPQSVFSVDVSDDFARTVQPRYGEVADSIARDSNRATLKLKLTPGGGRLQFALAYSNNLDVFEDSDLAGANKMFHEIALTGKWKILPKTAIQLDVSQQIYDYFNPGGGSYGSLTIQKAESTPLRIYFGLLGLITPSLSILAKLGYGNAFVQNNAPSYNHMLGIFELGYHFGPFAKLKLGYEHLFQDAIFASYYTDELIYIGYDHVVASRFILFARGEYRYRQYQGLPSGVGATSVNQNLVGASLGADYQIKDWIYVGLGYDLQLQNRSGASTTTYAPNFTKHQIFGKVGVSY